MRRGCLFSGLAAIVLGLVSLGWIAMIAYVVAGPDGLERSVARPAIPGAVRT